MKSVEQYQFVVGQLGRPYDFLAGPGTEAKGINCQRLIEMFVQQYFSVKLPFTYRSEEIYMDNGDYFKNIDFIRRTKFDDVHIFTDAQNGDPKKFHLAVQVAYLRERGEPLLMHANYVDRSVGIWPLGDFRICERYSRHIGTRRIIRAYERDGYQNTQDYR